MGTGIRPTDRFKGLDGADLSSRWMRPIGLVLFLGVTELIITESINPYASARYPYTYRPIADTELFKHFRISARRL